MTYRRGMGKGKGKGYYNIINKDKKVHSDSAKGKKQPQRYMSLQNKGTPEIINLGNGYTAYLSVEYKKDIITGEPYRKEEYVIKDSEGNFIGRQIVGDRTIERTKELMEEQISKKESQMKSRNEFMSKYTDEQWDKIIDTYNRETGSDLEKSDTVNALSKAKKYYLFYQNFDNIRPLDNDGASYLLEKDGKSYYAHYDGTRLKTFSKVNKDKLKTMINGQILSGKLKGTKKDKEFIDTVKEEIKEVGYSVG